MKIKTWVGRGLWGVLAASVAAATFGRVYPDPSDWHGTTADLLSAAALAAATGAIVLLAAIGAVAVLAATLRRWRLAAVAAATLVGLSLATFVVPTPTRLAGEPAFTVLSANLRRFSPTRGLLEAVERERPDVLLLQEVTENHVAALGDAGYPHVVAEPWDDVRWEGYACFSRFPVTAGPIETVGPAGLDDDVRVYELQIGGRVLTVLNVHPTSPRDLGRAAASRWEHCEIAAIAADLMRHGPVIVAGDFNAPPQSPARRRYRRLGLLPATALAGAGLPGTWPGDTRLTGYGLGWNIDNVLLSPGLTATAAHAGPLWGSDHRYVYAELSWSE